MSLSFSFACQFLATSNQLGSHLVVAPHATGHTPHATRVISAAKGAVDSAGSGGILNIQTSEGRAKSCTYWLKKAERKLKNVRNFYAVKNWRSSKKCGVFPLSCSEKHRPTNLHNLRFPIHNKKNKIHRYQQIIADLRFAPIIKLSVPQKPAFVVGCKKESYQFRLHSYMMLTVDC